mmetsp:Transcript_109651/g.194454  ORF Transcript_109651/g.194454 Transcript_109651/m.194454 type:complete len:265 (-) Transcript_109651:32-826(-)
MRNAAAALACAICAGSGHRVHRAERFQGKMNSAELGMADHHWQPLNALVTLLMAFNPMVSRYPVVATGSSLLPAQGAGASRRSAPLMAKDELDLIEIKATAAAEAWDTYVTDFVDADTVDAAESRFSALDVGYARAGGYSQAGRARMAFTNTEMLDVGGPGSTAAEFAKVYRITADFKESDPLPNVLDNIGVDLKNVGDILLNGDDCAFVVVNPEVAKLLERLLPKALEGTPVLVEEFEPSEDNPVEGKPQEVAIQRVDKRGRK